MFSPDGYLGCPQGLEKLLATQGLLCSKVVEQVNENQELMMLDTFTRESHEVQLKKCLQERISDIASWHWVLNDLSKRLDEAIGSLQHEHNSLRVVISRVKSEVQEHSREATRPGALCPMSDAVEDAVMQEYKYLKEQMKRFETMIDELDKETAKIIKTKMRIDDDVLRKQKTIDIEENWVRTEAAQFKLNYVGEGDKKQKKRKKCSPLDCWEKRCSSLKTAGLQSLSRAFTIRQQVRCARIQLSIEAQAHASKVDTALRRRLHANTAKLDELKWQRDEAVKDLLLLDEELKNTEQTLLEQLEKIQLVDARINDRKLRPAKELTKDEVDKTLRCELARLRRFTKELREAIARITTLKNSRLSSITKLDDVAEDIAQVVSLDKVRIHCRLGEEKTEHSSNITSNGQTEITQSKDCGLPTIEEYDEDVDDYPLDF